MNGRGIGRWSWWVLAGTSLLLVAGLSAAQDKPVRPDQLGDAKPKARPGMSADDYNRALLLDRELKAPSAGFDETAPATVDEEGGELRSVIRVTFRKASAEILDDRTAELDAFAEAIKGTRNWRRLRFQLEGHASTEGDPAFNQWLSEERAKAVARYLVERHGLAEDQLHTVGKGIEDPVMGPDGREDRQASRRVEVIRLWDREEP